LSGGRSYRYLLRHTTAREKPAAAKLRWWRISILRGRAHNLGMIEGAGRHDGRSAGGSA
jgi:hypothetical protein